MVELLVFTWWFSAIFVLGGGIFVVEAFNQRNIFTAATIGFVILLITRALFWGWYALVPEYIDIIPYLLGYFVLTAIYGQSINRSQAKESLTKALEHKDKKVRNAAKNTSEIIKCTAAVTETTAGYNIDYENGTIPIGDLPIGARVVDPSWEWEFRAGDNYTGNGEVKPVTWVIVAKDHYNPIEPHVTLLSEELIGRHAFDNSTDRDHENSKYGYNHWGESGTANATRGMRPWLNSTGIHSDEGFYQAFSERFKEAALTTSLPNKEWKNGTSYSISDYVFLPSTTELGDTEYNLTYRIGSVYPYFSGSGSAKRVARIGWETGWYWSRSPDSSYGCRVRGVGGDGEFYYLFADSGARFGVRPALNLKSEILVSEIKE